MEFPKYMSMGSKGPHVTLLQVFLVGAASSTDPGFEFDEEYGDRTALLVGDMQDEVDFHNDGNFGPDIRRDVLERFNFNFEEVCQLIAGETSFVQPDGSVILWRSPKSV